MITKLLNKVGLTNWRRRLIAAVIAVPVVTVPTVEVTSHSKFCNSCHIMGPYYDSWKHGSHKDVECVKCHIPPGVTNFISAKLNGLGQVVDDVLARTSMKPSASVNEVSCIRSGCHDVERLKASKKTDGKYLFAHDKHLDREFSGITIGCSTCHSHVKGDEHFEINTNVCITCHMLENVDVDPKDAERPENKGLIRLAVRENKHGIGSKPQPEGHAKLPPESCTACHNPPPGTLIRGGIKVTHADYLSYGAACESCHRGTTATPPPVDSGQCYACHTFGIERLGNTEEMHKVHNEGKHKIECFSCHGALHHGPKAQIATLEQFDCRRCHSDQHGVQRRAYLDDGSGPPTSAGSTTVSPMFVAHVDCTGCHVQQRPLNAKPGSGATVAVATPEACDECHKPGFGNEMIPLWQKSAHALYNQVEADLKAATSTVTSPAGTALLAEAKKLLELVHADGSWGVHNPRYTQSLLEQARSKVRAAGNGENGEKGR